LLTTSVTVQQMISRSNFQVVSQEVGVLYEISNRI
jgi:hypothetical protein